MADGADDLQAGTRRLRGRLLGVPNAALGLLLYAALAAALLLELPPLLLLAMTAPAVAMSAFLGYSLLANRRECRICWVGHFANAALFLMLGWRALGAA
jgi:uncharacterized membrane protein